MKGMRAKPHCVSVASNGTLTMAARHGAVMPDTTTTRFIIEEIQHGNGVCLDRASPQAHLTSSEAFSAHSLNLLVGVFGLIKGVSFTSDESKQSPDLTNPYRLFYATGDVSDPQPS